MDIEYKSIIQIKDSGKEPVTIQLEFAGIPTFGPMPPEKHIIKAYVLISAIEHNWKFVIRNFTCITNDCRLYALIKSSKQSVSD